MYTIIGGDGKEYGPVSADQVRGWIAAGRANSLTRMRAAGSEEWKTVADFPELMSAPAAAGPSGVSESHAKLDVISCYERSWALLKTRFWTFVGATALIIVVLGFLSYLEGHGFLFLYIVIDFPLTGGLSYYFLRHIRGEPAGFGDLFAGVKRPLGSLIVMGIIMMLLLTLGLVMVVLPGIYLAVAWTFGPILAVDKGLGIWEALETSRRVVTRNWWRVLGLTLLGLPFVLLGLAALGVGILVTFPLIAGACMYAYEDLFSAKR